MSEFEFPWQYHFPPFFTIQVNNETQKQQLSSWKQFMLNYLKSKKQCILDVREAQRSPLFQNPAINRELSTEGILVVLNYLSETGHAEPTDKSKRRWYIYWEPLEELAAAIYRWASANGMIGTVCTLYELSDGDSTLGEVFHGLDIEILMKALKSLQIKKKAELITFDDNQGVKFF